jgi:ABC-type transport system involved in multi-copper enzyme maturation permease subunit
MNWFTWQQHKKQFLVFGLLTAAFLALAIPTGMHFWDTYQNARAACTATGSCENLSSTLFRTGFDSRMIMIMKSVAIAVPFVLALFLGVPLIAREYSEGTNLLAWTQSVSRRKWLTIKLAWTLLFTVIMAGAIAATSTWWWRTGNELLLDRFQPLNFSIQGIVPVAFAVFAVAVGIALGAWFKRLLVAMALTLGLLIVVQTVVSTMVRPHYMTPVTHTSPMSLERGTNGASPDEAPMPENAGAAWLLDGVLVSPKGEALDWNNPPDKCSFTREQVEAQMKAAEQGGARPKGGFMHRDNGPIIGLGCLADEGYTWKTQYHPSSRYWNFQRIEAGLYLALTLIPLAATYVFVQRRDA